MKVFVLISSCERDLALSGPFTNKEDAIQAMLSELAEALDRSEKGIKALYRKYQKAPEHILGWKG